MFWRNETGLALNPRTGEPFTYGFKGSPDVIGFLRNGKFAGFECKTGKSIQTKEQKIFEAACIRNGAYYSVVRQAEDAKQSAEKALNP